MNKGFALITVLAVLIMIALGTAMVLQSLGSQTTMKSQNVQEIKAQYLAEAGMQHALWRCRTSGCQDETISVETTNDVAIHADTTVTPTKLVITVNYTNV